jgi:uncharacterized protein YukE
MGSGDIVGQAVAAAQADMNTVQAAADAIGAAVGKVRPWLTRETWEGNAAATWTGEWETFYRTVQNCLNDLPSAESDIVSAVRTQMLQIAAQRSEAPKT